MELMPTVIFGQLKQSSEGHRKYKPQLKLYPWWLAFDVRENMWGALTAAAFTATVTAAVILCQGATKATTREAQTEATSHEAPH